MAVSSSDEVTINHIDHFFHRISGESAKLVEDTYKNMLKNCSWPDLLYSVCKNGETFYILDPVNARGSFELITKVLDGKNDARFILIEKLYLVALMKVDPYIAINGVDSTEKLIKPERLDFLETMIRAD